MRPPEAIAAVGGAKARAPFALAEATICFREATACFREATVCFRTSSREKSTAEPIILLDILPGNAGNNSGTAALDTNKKETPR